MGDGRDVGGREGPRPPGVGDDSGADRGLGRGAPRCRRPDRRSDAEIVAEVVVPQLTEVAPRLGVDVDTVRARLDGVVRRARAIAPARRMPA